MDAGTRRTRLPLPWCKFVPPTDGDVTMACPSECHGRDHEWHLDISKAFRHSVFDLGAWSRQPTIVIFSLLFQTRFKAVGSICDSMGGYCIKYFMTELGVRCLRMVNEWLKRFYRLNGSLEAD